jgi:hypothetical protein
MKRGTCNCRSSSKPPSSRVDRPGCQSRSEDLLSMPTADVPKRHALAGEIRTCAQACFFKSK